MILQSKVDIIVYSLLSSRWALSHVLSESITCERDASRLEGDKKEQGTETNRHIAKARGYPFPPFLCKDSSRRQWRVFFLITLLFTGVARCEFTALRTVSGTTSTPIFTITITIADMSITTTQADSTGDLGKHFKYSFKNELKIERSKYKIKFLKIIIVK